jgi:hypothetical protein
MMAHRNVFASKNLDVPETSHDSISQAAKRSAGDLTPEPLLSVVCPDAAHGEKQGRSYRAMAANISRWIKRPISSRQSITPER